MLLRELKDAIVKQDQGTYVAVRPLLATKLLIEQWGRANGLPFLEDLHVTLLYSRTVIEMTPSRDEYHAQPVKIEELGDSIVIMLKSDDLTRRHEELIRLGGTHDYPEYLPHMSIAKVNPGIDYKRILDVPLPNFGMIFGREYAERLSD